MARPSVVYTCSNCDAQYPRWVGRCSQCGKFGTIGTEGAVVQQTKISSVSVSSAPAETVSLSQVAFGNVQRFSTGFAEADRVLGGGLVKGSVLLATGEPGVGKSTLFLAMADKANGALYASGEESAEQVSGRLHRLGLTGASLAFVASTDVSALVATIKQKQPRLVVVDSLQTFSHSGADGSPGSPSQVRAVASELAQMAKITGVPVVIIGHVTKEGVAAGPKTIEHLVDVVLALDGDSHQSLRFLRTSKNRFGSTDEVGVFKLDEAGFAEVPNPSELFLEHRHTGAGACVTSVLEGSRSLLIELQALVTRSQLARPTRATTGFDTNRLQMLLAVLGERAGLKLNFSDVYINLAGGFRSKEPALDLAVCLAAASASLKKTLPKDLIVFGEVGLGGEVRPVTGMVKRLTEAARLGFRQAMVPVLPNEVRLPAGLEPIVVHNIAEAVEWARH